MALTGTLEDLLNWLGLRLIEVYFAHDRAVVEIDVSLFECPPVLLGNNLVVVGFADSIVGQVLETGQIKLHLLLVPHVCKIE